MHQQLNTSRSTSDSEIFPLDREETDVRSQFTLSPDASALMRIQYQSSLFDESFNHSGLARALTLSCTSPCVQNFIARQIFLILTSK